MKTLFKEIWDEILAVRDATPLWDDDTTWYNERGQFYQFHKLYCSGQSPEYIEKIYDMYKNDERVSVSVKCYVYEHGESQYVDYDMEVDEPCININYFDGKTSGGNIIHICDCTLAEIISYQKDLIYNWLNENIDDENDHESVLNYYYDCIDTVANNYTDDYANLSGDEKVFIVINDAGDSEFDIYTAPKYPTGFEFGDIKAVMLIEFKEK